MRGKGLLESAMEVTKEYLRKHYDYDATTGTFYLREDPDNRYKDQYVGLPAGSQHLRGYLHIYINEKPYKAHRLVWVYFFGDWPEVVDHLNGRVWDNRLENLRATDQTTNNRNAKTRHDNISGISGLHYRPSTAAWVVQIGTDHGRKTLYQGKDFFEACCRRKAAEIRHRYTGRT